MYLKEVEQRMGREQKTEPGDVGSMTNLVPRPNTEGASDFFFEWLRGLSEQCL